MGIGKLEELLDLDKVSELLSSFYMSTGYGIGLISKGGEVLVKSDWQPICEEFHRRNPASLKNCQESDQRIDKEIKDIEFIDYKCLNGLVDAAIPLIIDGEHLASLFFGQFFYKGEEGSEEEFRARAREFGFPEEEYIKAYKQIPVYSREQVAEIMRFCGSLVNMLTEMGKKNLNLKAELSAKQKYEQQLKLSESRYRTLLETSSDPLFTIDYQGRYIFLNKEAAWQLGGKPKDFEGKLMTDFFPPEIGEKHLAAIQHVIQKQKSIATETRTILNGKEHWYSMHINPVKDDEGKILYAQSIARDITDLKNAQKRIAEQNLFLESIYSGTSAAIFVMDVTEDGQFVYRGLNPAHERISGFRSEELEGKTPDEITDLIPPEAIGEIKKRYQSCLDADDVVSYEEMIPMRENNIWWLTTLTPIKDDKGNIYRIIGSALDITDLKKTQKELEDHKQHLEEMVAQQTEELKASNEQLLEEVEERKIIEEDRARLLLQTQERIKEMSCLNSINALLDEDDIDLKDVYKQIVDLIPPAWFYPDHTWCQLRIEDEVYESISFRKTDYSHKIKIYRNEEEAGELEVFLDQGKDREFLNEELSLLNNIGISISNTLTKMAIQKRLKEVKLAMEYGRNGFAMGDLNGIIYEVNKAFLNMWGADSEEDVLGKLYSDLLADKQKAKSIIEGMMSEGFWKGEIKALRLDSSEFDINIAANLVFDEKGNVIALAASIVDISELKAAQAKLQEIMTDLERSNKDLENFAYVASHDLQEPLRKTASFTQLLAQKYNEQLDERAQKYIHYITDGSERMQGLITGLLKFSRVSTRGREFTKVDMQEVVDTTLSNLSLMIKENEAEIDCGKMPEVMADESQILSVMQNLITNALKFKAERKPEIKIRAKSRKKDWLFSISDNGIGIKEEFAEKIFIIFQRLHNRDQYPGSGIGLAVVKKIVERHGGDIWFESTPGEGTTFYFTLKKEDR